MISMARETPPGFPARTFPSRHPAQSLYGKNKKERAGLRRALSNVTVSDSLVQAEPLVELRDPAAGVHQLLLAGEEGVTLRADFHLDILLGRTCLNHITAGACNRSLLIIGMDSFLHCSVHPFLKRIAL